jgi:hypothetical protein
MPGGDRTGPLGLGPRTGRGFGYCTGFGDPGFFGYRGRGRGFGRGFGWRWAGGVYPPPYNVPYYPPSIAGEKTYLEEEIKVLREQITGLEKRLDELKKSEEK